MTSRRKYKNDPNLVGKRHIFDQTMHDKYDIPARKKVIEILGEDVVKNNPDIYQQDLIITCGDCKYKYLELQVCADWIAEKYPFPNVFVYERKAKYDNDTLYLTLNRHLTRAKLFDRKSFCDKPRRLKKYSREFVYDIHHYRVIDIYDINDLDEDLICIY